METAADIHDPFAIVQIPHLMDKEHGKSSKKQDQSARSKFDEFLSRHVSSELSLVDLPASEVTASLMGQFTTFLLEDPRIHFQTSMNYLSSVRRQLEESTGTQLFKDEKWYARLRGNLNSKYLLQCIDSGKTLKNQAPVMTMTDLETLSRALFARGDKKSLKYRTLLNQQWNAIGRSSDVGSLTFDDLQWRDTQLFIRLTRVKVRMQHTIAVVCSALKWEVDPYHSLACQLACDPFYVGLDLFDQIGASKKDDDKVAAYINQLLSNLSATIEGDLTTNLKSQSSRRGSAVQASSSEHVNLSDLAHRGRWTMDGFATLLEYIAETSAADQKVARVLSGWEDPKHTVKPPQLTDSSDLKQTKAVKVGFAEYLFFHYLMRLKNVAFCHVLAASLLLYLDKTHSVAPDHAVHGAMVTAIRSQNPLLCPTDAMGVLLKWSESTRRHFVLDNMVSLPASDVVDNLTADDVEQRYVAAHTFIDTLEKLLVSSRSLAGGFVQIQAQLGLIESRQSQVLDAVEFIRKHIVNPVDQMQEGKPIEEMQPSRLWPVNLQSLAGVSMSSLVYQYLYQDLHSVPTVRSNRAQSEARAAMNIAYQFIGANSPVPYASLGSDSARARWKHDVQALAVTVERDVLARLDSPVDVSGKRKRKLTGSATGIVRAWSKSRKGNSD